MRCVLVRWRVGVTVVIFLPALSRLAPLQNKLGEMSVGEMRVCEVWCWQNEGVDEKGRMWVLVKCGRN